jgi:hypothetical protein
MIAVLMEECEMLERRPPQLEEGQQHITLRKEYRINPKTGNKTGPYWYGYWKENGKTRKCYYGKYPPEAPVTPPTRNQRPSSAALADIGAPSSRAAAAPASAPPPSSPPPSSSAVVDVPASGQAIEEHELG